jgi:hypothetical protein
LSSKHIFVRTWWCGVILSGQVWDVWTNRSAYIITHARADSVTFCCTHARASHGITDRRAFNVTQRLPDSDPNLVTDRFAHRNAVCETHCIAIFSSHGFPNCCTHYISLDCSVCIAHGDAHGSNGNTNWFANLCGAHSATHAEPGGITYCRANEYSYSNTSRHANSGSNSTARGDTNSCSEHHTVCCSDGFTDA